MNGAALDAAKPAGEVGSVASALKILSHLADSPRSLRLKDIAGPLGLNPSTCLNILRTLVRAGVVHVDPSTKTYGLGLALAALARAALSRDARLAAARPLIAEAASKHALTVMLWRRACLDEMVLLAAASGHDAWRVQVEVGSKAPILQGSMGRVMAVRAGLSEDELQSRFERLKWERPLSFADFMAQATAASERGFGCDDGYFHRSMASLSVPIIEPDGRCESVLTAAMFVGQYDEANMNQIARDLAHMAQIIGNEPFRPA